MTSNAAIWRRKTLQVGRHNAKFKHIATVFFEIVKQQPTIGGVVPDRPFVKPCLGDLFCGLRIVGVEAHLNPVLVVESVLDDEAALA